MKKIRFYLPLLAAMIVVPRLHAEWSPLYEQAKDKGVDVTYRLSLSATQMSTAVVLVSLENITTWPHKETDSLKIQSIRVDVDKAAASTSTVRIGVINYIDSSSSTVTWFWNKENENNVSNTDVTNYTNYPAALSLRVAKGSAKIEGTTENILSNLTSNWALFTSSVAITPSPGGFVRPRVGDLVAYIQKGAVAIVYTFEVYYNSERSR